MLVQVGCTAEACLGSKDTHHLQPHPFGGGYLQIAIEMDAHCPGHLREALHSSDLERLTEPSDLAQGDEAGGEGGGSLVDVGAALVADGQAAKAVEPCVGALHHPAVAAEPLAARGPAPADWSAPSASFSGILNSDGGWMPCLVNASLGAAFR